MHLLSNSENQGNLICSLMLRFFLIISHSYPSFCLGFYINEAIALFEEERSALINNNVMKNVRCSKTREDK